MPFFGPKNIFFHPTSPDFRRFDLKISSGIIFLLSGAHLGVPFQCYKISWTKKWIPSTSWRRGVIAKPFPLKNIFKSAICAVVVSKCAMSTVKMCYIHIKFSNGPPNAVEWNWCFYLLYTNNVVQFHHQFQYLYLLQPWKLNN